MYDKSSTNPHSFNSSLANVPRRTNIIQLLSELRLKELFSDPAELLVVPKMKSGINFGGDE